MAGPSQRTVMPVERVGVPPRTLRPLYASLIHTSWTGLLIYGAGAYLAANLLFAAAFMLSGAHIDGADPVTFRAALAFSVQTLSTIGFGALSPGDAVADFIVGVESFVGLLGVAMATGVVFAKFALPVPGVLFSNRAVIDAHEGRRALIFRVANARGGDLINAQVKATAVTFTTTKEGEPHGKVHDLELLRAEMPMLVLSWTVVHYIDEQSPLFGLSLDDLAERDLRIYAILTGIDGTFMQTVYAYQGYTTADVVEGGRFVNIIDRLDSGGRRLDLRKLHDIRTDDA